MLGIAHGWAGFLYALMQWKRTQGKEPGDGIRERLQQLEELGEERGTGMRWKIRLDARRGSPTQYMIGWCNGSAAMVFLANFCTRRREAVSRQ
jgi:eukaryotic-like serine/threonine-protein kinase